MKSLASGQHFPKSVRPSRVGNSHTNSSICPKIERVQDFMIVLITCKFDDHKWNRYCPDNICPIICLWEAKGKVTLMLIFRSVPKLSSSKILWLSSFPASLIKIRSKMKSLLPGQHFLKSMGLSGAGNSHDNSKHWAKNRTCSASLLLMKSLSKTRTPIF